MPLPLARPVPGRGASSCRAVILDVDGTLYRQAPVQLGMAVRLARAAARRPREGYRWWRVLRAYRHAQEELRARGCTQAGEEQLALAVARSGVAPGAALACVERWMGEEPCALLARHRRAGLLPFLTSARAAGWRVGVFSDYPAARKLAALGVAALVDAVRSAHDPAVGRFKPAPDGLLAVAAALDVPPGECIYVGDRPQVDGAAAAAAGMPAYIVGREAAAGAPAGASWQPVPDFHALAAALRLA